MAHLHRKILIHTLHDEWSYTSIACRTRSGRTLLVDKPRSKEKRAGAPALPRILRAGTYAGFVRTHEAYLERAAETGVDAYTIALAHWFGKPRVLQIDVDRWTGQPRQKIGVKARDSLRVAGVLVVIRDAQGNVLESGEAAPSPTRGDWWTYTTTSCVALTPFPAVEAVARNLPGNRDSFMI